MRRFRHTSEPRSAVLRFALLCSLLVLLLMPAAGNAAEAVAVDKSPDSDADGLEIFQKRILPIFEAKNPSSCSECHLSGVDLKDYILPTQKATFAALVQGELIDVKNPEKSKLLEFISRRPKNPNLMTDRVRDEEYAAFHAWILAAVKDPTLQGKADPDIHVGSPLPVEVIRHARHDRVLASFVENVWSEVGRCAACHSPDKNHRQAAKFGDRVSWIKVGDPEATLAYLIEAELIDSDSPEDSLLVTKPSLQDDHVGGRKMAVGDRSYTQFRRFIDDYAAIVNGMYASADQLPAPSEEVFALSPIWLRVAGLPDRYEGKFLQVDLHRREGDGWSAARSATSERMIGGKPGSLNWQHDVSLAAPRGSKQAEEMKNKQTLPPGQYQVRFFIDQDDKLQKTFPAELGQDDLVGETVIDSNWKPGYRQMTVVTFPDVP